MSTFGTAGAAMSFNRTDKILSGKTDGLASRADIKKSYDTASGDEKAHLKKVLDGYDKLKKDKNGAIDKNGCINGNTFGELYG